MLVITGRAYRLQFLDHFKARPQFRKVCATSNFQKATNRHAFFGVMSSTENADCSKLVNRKRSRVSLKYKSPCDHFSGLNCV
mmetsp:Transcript_41354/g.72034  ORF Transcript_41354/g.72034 Transcript_41354/m.72034 type:complete len:82 (-) Transcript_41354:298-543(-)